MSPSQVGVEYCRWGLILLGGGSDLPRNYVLDESLYDFEIHSHVTLKRVVLAYWHPCTYKVGAYLSAESLQYTRAE